MKYNLTTLIAQFQKGNRIKYLFFWGHQPSKNGSVTAACFSQWWHAPFKVNGNVFHTAEHWMMFQKAMLFKDNKMAIEILKSTSPAQAKALGRKVKNFKPAVWDQHKFQIVVEGNKHKFDQHEDLRSFLINSGKRILVEASPRDRIWGIGMGKENEKAENPLLWRGENLLGFALMEVRDELKN